MPIYCLKAKSRRYTNISRRVADLHFGVHSALPAPVAWWYRFDCLQSVVGPSTFLDLGSGMDCPKTLFRRRHFQVSGADLNPSSSSSHILILSSNCTFDTIVVLVVMFITWATLKITELNWTELNWIQDCQKLVLYFADIFGRTVRYKMFRRCTRAAIRLLPSTITWSDPLIQRSVMRQTHVWRWQCCLSNVTLRDLLNMKAALCCLASNCKQRCRFITVGDSGEAGRHDAGDARCGDLISCDVTPRPVGRCTLGRWNRRDYRHQLEWRHTRSSH